MKRVVIAIAGFFIFGLSSCGLVNDLVPDIDTDYSKTFQVRIFSNDAETESQVIDVSSSTEYKDFKNNIEGFELRKITYEIKNYNAPEDLYFSGEIVCSNEEETESFVIGRISKAKISDLADSGHENDLTEARENIGTVLSWLDNPGRLKIKTAYLLKDLNDKPYKINGLNSGSNFELIVKLYLTVKTKV